MTKSITISRVNIIVEPPFLEDLKVTNVICEFLKGSYSMEDFLTSQIMKTLEKSTSLNWCYK